MSYVPFISQTLQTALSLPCPHWGQHLQAPPGLSLGGSSRDPGTGPLQPRGKQRDLRAPPTSVRENTDHSLSPGHRSVFPGQMPSLLKQQPLKNNATISIRRDLFLLPPYKTTPVLFCLQVSRGWEPDVCAWRCSLCSALGTRATGSSTAGHRERSTPPANGYGLARTQEFFCQLVSHSQKKTPNQQ